MKNVIIYGMAGADQMYRIKCYYCFFDDVVGIDEIRFRMSGMRMKFPDIKKVYLMENRRGLNREFKTAMRLNTIESWAIFKDTLEREGLLLVIPEKA